MPAPAAPSGRPPDSRAAAGPAPAGPSPAGRPLADHAPLSFAGFVALIAAMMALNAVAIDVMLPALPEIGDALGVGRPNDRQAVISAYLAGFGLAQLFIGVLSDRFGRRPLLLAGIVLYVAGAAASTAAGDFGALLAARAAQGVGAAAPRVILAAVVRDCYEGRTMAKVMSLAMMTFMAAPVVAPSLGQAILAVGHWRAIFAALAVYGALVLAAVALALPETLPRAHRRPIDARGIAASLRTVLGARQTLGYALASGIFFGALFGFIASAQQIFVDIYALGPWFPVVFGAIAAGIAFSAFLNAMLVQRLGMRALSHAAVLAFTAVSATLAALAWQGPPPLWAFLALLGGAMMLVGMVFSNFGALAMEPQAAAAGLASSLIGGATTLIGAGIGFAIGRAFDGTVLPLALGYAACGLATLGVIALTERGRLFGGGAGR
jgi:DHA1 family bicyclomycin/chloramphenicol resistance-like MFS transporter